MARGSPHLANGHSGASRGAFRSHLEVEIEDPDVGRKFAANTTTTGSGSLRSMPSMVHGAPTSEEESREVLGRLRRMAGFESQTFDPTENDVEREFQVHRTERDYALAEVWRWIIAFLIGVTMGFLGFAVDWGIGLLNDVKYFRTQQVIISERGFWKPYFVFIFFSCGYAFIAASLVSFVAPLAAGSGIAEVKTYLNGIHIRGLLTVRTLVAKLAGVVFSIAAGLIAGKEGPFVHGGAIIGGGISAMGSQTATALSRGRFAAKLPRWLGGFFRNDADHRDFTAIGTAAGVATAFAAPIGGLLFTIEEGASFYSTSMFWRGFLSTGIGVFTLHFLVEASEHPNSLSKAHFGRYRDFGLYTDSLAHYGSRMFYYFWDVPIFCMMGAVGGLMGALWVHLNVKITALRHKYVPVRSPVKRMLEVVALVFVTASVWYIVAWSSPCHSLPNRSDLEQFEQSEDMDEEFYAGGGQFRRQESEHFPQLWCANGSYSVYGQVFFTPLSQALRLIMHLGEPLDDDRLNLFQFNYGSIILFFLLTYMLMIATNGVGASTGMFVPALAVGAAGGRLSGQIVRAIVRGMDVRLPNNKPLPVSLTSYAVVGAAAYMGGATRMTLTTTVMVMETTGALQLIVPIIMTVFTAKVVGDWFGMGMDDTHIKMRGAPVLDEPALSPHSKMIADKLTVSELMSMAIVALPPVVRVRQLVETLRCCGHQAFPVTPDVRKAFDNAEPFDLHGIVLRETLLKLVQYRIGFFQPEPSGEIPTSRSHVPATQRERLTLLESLEQRPIKSRREDQDLELRTLTEAELDLLVDVRPFMQRNPFIVHADASLSRAYRLFRTMGLRHLFVCEPQPRVIGVITRKDVAEANAKLALGRKANLGLTTPSERLVTTGNLPFIPYGAYDPTVGMQLSPLEEGEEESGYAGINRKFTLEDGSTEGAASDPLGRDTGRRRAVGSRNRAADTESEASPGAESRALLDDGRHVV
ncbi:hypothetical protein WJX73_008199 [Symbiochloris irregularis]|uniref:Chloride channel protein n=1 Tax=Symbiochloris irregularis TaxID=706552 RepID=A0AAW1NQ60_9CHLO